YAACGGLIYDSDDVIITNNTLDGNLVGVYYYGGNGTIAYNTFTNNKWAINLYGDAYIYGNTFSGNTYNLTYMAEIVGTNHFWDVIQDAINNATDGDTIKVYDGVYEESLTIDKSINLIAGSSPVIKCPATPEDVKIQESTHTFEYVIGIFGGTYGSGNDTYYGPGTINVNISGFTIDSNDKTPSDRFVGIFFRNLIGNISGCTIVNTSVDGKETFGILGYGGNSDITIYGNTVNQFGRGGIGVNCGLGATCLVKENTVVGPGKNPVVTWAPNGIQVGYGTTGIITENDVSSCGWNGSSWSGTGILVVDTNVSSVTVDNNYVHNCESGIVFVAYWDYCSSAVITNNTVEDTDWSIALHNDIRSATIMYNTVVNCTGDCIDVWNYSWFAGAPTNVEIHYNNFMDAVYDGLWVGSYVTQTVDAEYNYWGHPSGPYNATLNPTGQGVSVVGNVDFIPWLDDEWPDDDYDYNETSGVEDAYYEDVPAGTETTVDGTADTDTTVTVNSTNPIGVTILLYEGNPEGTNQGAYAMGKYLDIIINDTSGVQWPINITIYYTLQDLIDSGLSEDDIVGIMFWNGTAGEWQYYNDTGVNKDYFDGTYIGYVWANAWHLTPVGLGGNDTQAPTTTKTVGQPKYGPFPPYDLYVTSSTQFNLTAVDNPSNGSGVNATYYRIWYNGAWTPWTLYTGNFTLTGECKHYLEFYSVDNAGNAEAVHNQTHYVDDTPPQSFLVVGDPKWPQNQGATFVTTSTVITLYANDIYGPCNVGSFHMHYRIWNGTWTPWQVGGLGEVINITFSEECKHYIEYYAEDNLGNTETTIHNRTFYVDDTPPTSSIELGEPKCGYALEFDGNDYVDISNPD
ncbi:MAG TPA: hypothetical protein ENI33_06880, partial [Thermoplasmatales archaeon]|nr:hypothetical protein [Thermoplasmatales archaeon]